MTTVFSATLTSGNDSGNTGYSFRQRFTTLAGSQGQVRVTFEAPSVTTSFQTDHCSIGVAVVSPVPTAAGAVDTQATPVELLFTGPFAGSGGHGFLITAGNTLTSEWANLNWNNGDDLVLIIDFASSNANERFLGGPGGHLYYASGTATYADSHPTSGTWVTQTEVLTWVAAGFNLVETQSGAVADTTTLIQSVISHVGYRAKPMGY